MGMAASQARLLALTARMHDIELRAQNIEAQKLSLATQEDEAYEKYCAALDAKKIQVGVMSDIGAISYVDANYSSVCGFHKMNCCQYSLVNNVTGKVIVSPEIKAIYDQFHSDKYTFAWAAMGYTQQFGWSGSAGPWGLQPDALCGGDSVGINSNVNFGLAGQNYPSGVNPPAGYGTDLYMTEAEYAVFLLHQNDSDLVDKYDAIYQASVAGDSVKERKELLKAFRETLYASYGQEILNAMNQNKNYPQEDITDPDGWTHPIPDAFSDNAIWGNSVKKEFNYYTSLFEQIEQAGGCETIGEQYMSGETGTEWFNNMATSGLMSIYTLDTTGDNGWQVTTIATSVGNNYLQEVSDDDKAKKAEVEYEHTLKIINRKDTKFDTELKKLETEETACKTEIDSIKKVKNDNIERTFNLFS